MTIGTSIICASFLFPSFCFMFTCHTPPRRNAKLAGEDRKWPTFVFRTYSGLTRTGDTENRGSFRCGFCSGFYRGPHPVSNECGSLPESVSTDAPALRVRASPRHRQHQCFPSPQCVPVTTTTLHPAPPDLFARPAAAEGPSSSCL